MRIVFMGAPEFSVPTLRRVVDAGYSVVAVYTRAPKPGGRRGLEIHKTPVHLTAESLGIPVFTPVTLKTEEAQGEFRSHAADVGLVIAFGLLLPVGVLTAPKLGCLNLHASLLPRWRGAAPIQRAIMSGDLETGVDLMRIEAGLDTGPVADREVIPIRPQDTAGDLTSRMAHISAHLAVCGLSALKAGTLSFMPQSDEGVSYARKIEKGETEIDWTRDAASVRNHIHGLSPTPGAFSTLMIRGLAERFKVLRSEVVSAVGPPGVILDEGMTVACGEGAIRVLEGQQAGRTSVSGAEFLRRTAIPPGAAFMRTGSPSAVT